MNRRSKLREPDERILKAKSAKVKKKIEAKLKKYSELVAKDKKYVKRHRRYLREQWVIIGIHDLDLELATMMWMYERFSDLDVIPTHYYYPELYCL